MTMTYRPLSILARNVGEKVRTARLTRRVTLNELAGRMGKISPSYLSVHERGAYLFSVEQLQRIIKALDLPDDYFDNETPLIAEYEKREQDEDVDREHVDQEHRVFRAYLKLPLELRMAVTEAFQRIAVELNR